jgi:hypothetical protein
VSFAQRVAHLALLASLSVSCTRILTFFLNRAIAYRTLFLGIKVNMFRTFTRFNKLACLRSKTGGVISSLELLNMLWMFYTLVCTCRMSLLDCLSS